MPLGGLFGHPHIRPFNAHLFEDSTVFELNDGSAAPCGSLRGGLAIRGTQHHGHALRPRPGPRPAGRAGRAIHRARRHRDHRRAGPNGPFRREWTALKADIVGVEVTRLKSLEAKSEPPHVGSYNGKREKLAAFLKKLRAIIVLDPACGSGNFLYVALQMLLDLEKEVITFAAQLGFQFQPEVGVHQLRAIEINPYAYELAQVTVQIGYLQWLRENGFALDRSPVLQVLDGFHNEDALLVPHYRSKTKTLKEAQAGEHAEDTALKFYTEREWPKCDVIVSNPPFLGGKMLRRELGDA